MNPGSLEAKEAGKATMVCQQIENEACNTDVRLISCVCLVSLSRIEGLFLSRN
jgi:hypothetical protein